MAGYAPQADGEVINLISDSEEEAQELDNPNVGLLQPPSPLFDLGEPDAYFADFMNWEEPQPGNLAASPNVNPPMAYAEGPKALSEEECVQLITNVLAGISLSHVLNLVKERKVQTVAECERLITVLLDNGSYPKESDEARQRKRKRKASEGSSDVDEDATNYTKGQQPINTPAYRRDS
jgi:TRIAD3 protein (E3 ubiquitin-protein ligase RNF216)